MAQDTTQTTAPDRLTAIVADRVIAPARLESLRLALQLGADDATLTTIRDATRLNRKETILVPVLHLETLSRGRGWCRQGRGDSAVWAERERGQQGGSFYRVGPGHWTVGASDGFARKDSCEWDVRNIAVGDQVWTVAE